MPFFLALPVLFLLHPFLNAAQNLSTSKGSSVPTNTIFLPTTPYTGQAILTGSCSQPQYTAIQFDNGAHVFVPLVGCSDEYPECCPSLNLALSNTETTTTGTTSMATDSGAIITPTGVLSLLSQHPLTICPQGFTEINEICCPSGYSLYTAELLAGGLSACHSTQTTSLSIPQRVLASISSEIETSFLFTAAASSPVTTTTLTPTTISTSTTAAPTVSASVEVQIIFALPLLCADDSTTSGLSIGAKAGIGAGGAVAGLFLFGFLWLCCARWRRKDKRAIKERGLLAGSSIPIASPMAQQFQTAQYGGGSAYYAQQQLQAQPYEKNVSSISETTMPAMMTPPLASLGTPQLTQSGTPPYPGVGGSRGSDTGHGRGAGLGMHSDYAQGYLHGVHSAMVIQQGQRSPPLHEAAQGPVAGGGGWGRGKTIDGGELGGTGIAEIDSSKGRR